MEGLVILEASDWVEIRYGNGEVLFQGKIESDFNAGKAPAASALGQGRPRALGSWSHWTQTGFTPDEWASFFVLGNEYYGYVKKADGS